MKYPPPGTKYSTLIAAAKQSSESFQQVHYLQHDLCAILALIKKSSEILPGHGLRAQLCQSQPSLGTGTSPWLPWAPSPASGTSPALCQVVLMPVLSTKLPQHRSNKKQLILCWFSILKRDIPVQPEVQILRMCQKTARQRGENKTKQIKKERKKVFWSSICLPTEHCFFPLCIIFLKYNHTLHKEIM